MEVLFDMNRNVFGYGDIKIWWFNIFMLRVHIRLS